jgi:hypothetical protein
LTRSLFADFRVNLFRANFQSYSLGVTIHFSQQFGVVLQNSGHVRMRGAERFLTGGQSAFEEWLGLGAPALRFVEVGQIVEFYGGVGMIGAEGFLSGGQGAFVERLGLGVLAL